MVSCFYNYLFNFQPAECQALIEKLRSCSRKELLEELKKIDTWTFGKCELFHWIEILDLCDSILESAASRVNPKSWQLSCDLPANSEVSNSHLVCPFAKSRCSKLFSNTAGPTPILKKSTFCVPLTILF